MDQLPGQGRGRAPGALAAPPGAQGQAPEGLAPERHVVVRELGSGASSDVYLVLERSAGRLAALKVFDGRGLPAQRAREVANEAVILQKLAHQSVVRLLGLMHSDGHLALLMEYAGPESLLRAIGSAAQQRLLTMQSRQLFAQLAAGLEHCHLRDVAHRDLKPLNVVLSADGQTAKLVDFGSASTLAVRCEHVGTAPFMAPEVLVLQPAPCYSAAKADVWSLGVLLLEMLCGLNCLPQTLQWHLPCDPGPSLAADLRRLLADRASLGRVLEQRMLQPPGDPALRDLLGRMLCVNARRRWTASTVVAAAWLAGAD